MWELQLPPLSQSNIGSDRHTLLYLPYLPVDRKSLLTAHSVPTILRGSQLVLSLYSAGRAVPSFYPPRYKGSMGTLLSIVTLRGPISLYPSASACGDLARSG